jgi:hypothetical protein
MVESFLKTMKRDYIAFVPKPDAATTAREGDGTQNTQPLGLAGQSVHLSLVPVGADKSTDAANPTTTVALFDQGLVQVLQAAVTGLHPKEPYVLGLAHNPDGSGNVEVLAKFTTNPAGSAIVNALGQIRQLVTPGASTAGEKRRYLVIEPQDAGTPGRPVQVQSL